MTLPPSEKLFLKYVETENVPETFGENLRSKVQDTIKDSRHKVRIIENVVDGALLLPLDQKYQRDDLIMYQSVLSDTAYGHIFQSITEGIIASGLCAHSTRKEGNVIFLVGMKRQNNGTILILEVVNDTEIKLYEAETLPDYLDSL